MRNKSEGFFLFLPQNESKRVRESAYLRFRNILFGEDFKRRGKGNATNYLDCSMYCLIFIMSMLVGTI